MAAAKRSQSLQVIIGQLRNDFELIERKWDTFSEGKVPNSGRESLLNAIQGYYRLRPTEGRQTFCIGDIASVHDALHLHRRYNYRASVEKVLDVLVDLRLLRWNVERLLRTLGNHSNTVSSREKLLSLQNDTGTWKEVLADKFSLVELTAPSSPLFSRSLGDTLWRCVDTATMMANYILEAIENHWPLSLLLMWRRVAAKEFNASAALENSAAKTSKHGTKESTYQRQGMGAKELDKLINRKQKLLKSMEADNRRKTKNDRTWDDIDDDGFEGSEDLSNDTIDDLPVAKVTEPPKQESSPRKGVKVRFDDDTSMISTEGNVTVHIVNHQQDRLDRNDSRLSYQIQQYQATKRRSPSPIRATYIGSTKDSEEMSKGRPYMDILKNADDNNSLVVIRRPQMEKKVLLPSVHAPYANTTPRGSTATLRPARVLLTEVPEDSEPSVSIKDLKNMVEKIETLDGTVVDIHGDMRRELTRLRTSIRQRLRAVQQQIYDFDSSVDKITNTMY